MRRANAKFAKDNESRMGKSEDQIKKRTKEAPKSPISPIWFGELLPTFTKASIPGLAVPFASLSPFYQPLEVSQL
ncbi:hypothetical protein CSUB01_01025 [Colletotrichum sublineola]|uniref:Stress-associated endoplasmic reticulum protein n=1 Tax=Colletotrichum sublineola TaxID=1173701 RepID=A0A066X483_COLSU|nr:hypothetical protein CSUB01_01025 [Colletotrichum sublineola]